jgi:hypothetical protein
MFHLVRNLLASLLAVLLSTLAAFAELPRPVETPLLPKLHSLAHKAGYIFSGTVKSVERVAPRDANSAPVMRITFRVNDAFLGVRNGQDLVIHEFAGLWQSGESYRQGERVLLFLYPPSKLGLTSPVGGVSGRFNVDPGGRIIIPGRVILPNHPGSRRPLVPKATLSPEDFARLLRSVL